MPTEFIPYPDLENKNFYEKLYHKKEFYDTRPDVLPDPSNQSNETMSLLFPKDKNFKLQPAQMFLKNFISEATPYRGILIFHGTGTGKTCASIVIAERFHERVNKTGKKVLLIVNRNIENEFYKTIFDFEKEAKKKSKQIVQCTGKTYRLGTDTKYMSAKKQEIQITKMIKDIYEITTRDSLRNKLLRETGWNGDEDTLNDKFKKKIKEIYSDRIIIIDEAHNRVATIDKDKSIPTVLNAIIGNAENVTLILMSATPMVNSPKDIIFPINLLRLNDRRQQFSARSIFKSNGDFTNDGEKLLKKMCKGYISYVRGGDPPRFPYKITPPEATIPTPKFLFNGDKIPDNEKIKHTKIIKCYMEPFQYNTYILEIKDEIKTNNFKTKVGGLLQGAFQAGDISFPSTTSEKYGTFGKKGYGGSRSTDHALTENVNSRGNRTYQYSAFANGFLLRKNISKYSTKIASLYDNIVSSTGISFVYSRYVPGCITPIALMLEENGFEPANITGKENIQFHSNTKKPSICYMCGKVKHGPENHTWSPAKYVLLTGSIDLSKADFAKISGYINREENMYGKLVKVLIGSEVSGEGIDFKRIRQVHVMEPWYNEAKIDQVEGRAVRNGSHRDLPPDQRNVEIFKYCIVPPEQLQKNKYIETIDEYCYRIAEDKDKKIKKVEYILKQIAIDCLFQRDNNIRNINRTIKLEDSKGQIINYVTGDKPYSRECNYMKSCTYNCEWEPKKYTDIIVNKSTYGIEFAETDIEKARNELFDLYKVNPIIDSTTIFNVIKEKHPNIEDIYIHLALESLMDKNSDYSISDKYGREGYLVEKGDLYLFHPFELHDHKAPSIYKRTPLETKPPTVPFSASNIERKNNISIKNKINGKNIMEESFNSYNFTKSLLSYYSDNIYNFDDIIISIILYKLSDVKTLELLKLIISPLYQENKSKDIEKFRQLIINYYTVNNNILITNKTISVMAGNLCTQWERSKYSSKKTDKQKWGMCDADIEALMISNLNNVNYEMLWNKVPEDKKIREDENISRSEYLFILKQSDIRPIYMGTVGTKKIGGPKYLKILDFTKSDHDNVISKRKELRGRVCSSILIPDLKIILNKLEKVIMKENIKNLKIPETSIEKIARPNICLKIEFLFRVLNKYATDVWFYRDIFTLDDMEDIY